MAEPFNNLPFSPIADNRERSLETLKFLNERFPGVDSLVNHSSQNVKTGNTLRRDSGQTSSISSMTVGILGSEFGSSDQGLRTFLVPTIFDGRQLSGDEAKAKAVELMRQGVVFPSVEGDNPQALDEVSRLISANLENVNGMQNRLVR